MDSNASDIREDHIAFTSCDPGTLSLQGRPATKRLTKSLERTTGRRQRFRVNADVCPRLPVFAQFRRSPIEIQMAYIQRITFRHLYSIRHQVVGALGMVFKSMPKYDFIEWLHDSAPQMVSFVHESSGNGSLYFRHDESKKTHFQNYAMLINLCLMAYEAQMSAHDASIAAYHANDIISTSYSDHAAEDDYGTELGGSWDVEAFIIRSGIVLTFGAIEEFERGVIRVLLSLGKQGQRRKAPSITARLKDFDAITSEWAALEKTRKTYSVKGRHEVLSSFGLNADIDTEWNRRLKLMRNDRNQIAHGFKAVSHLFQPFVLLHYDCFAAVREIARQAKEVQHIVL